MPIWTEHQVHYLTVDIEHQGPLTSRFRSDFIERLRDGVETRHHFVPDAARLAEELHIVLDGLACEGFEIFSIMGIQGGETVGLHQYGAGASANVAHAWTMNASANASPTSGILVVGRRASEIDDVEFEDRHQARTSQHRLFLMERDKAAVTKRLDWLEDRLPKIEKRQVELSGREKKKYRYWGGHKYVVGPYQFSDMSELLQEWEATDRLHEELTREAEQLRGDLDQLNQEFDHLSNETNRNKEP